MYKVYYKIIFSPEELETWVNEKKEEGLELVAIDNGYYIFKEKETVNIKGCCRN